jgi:hypothetical protein
MPTDPNVSQLNPIYILSHDFCKINFNPTLPLSFSRTFPLKFYRNLHRITCSSSRKSTLTILMNNVKQWYSTETGNFITCTCFLFCKECLTNNSFLQVTMLSQSRGCMYVRTYIFMYVRMRARARTHTHTHTHTRSQWNTLDSHHPSVYIKCHFVLRILSARRATASQGIALGQIKPQLICQYPRKNQFPTRRTGARSSAKTLLMLWAPTDNITTHNFERLLLPCVVYTAGALVRGCLLVQEITTADEARSDNEVYNGNG